MRVTKNSLIALLAATLMLAVGCDDKTLEVPGQNNNQVVNHGDSDGDGDHDGHNHGPGDSEYTETHGPDDDEVLIEPGPLNGSWRVALSENDQPLAYFDIFQDEGATEGQGNFLMGMAMGEILDGTAGDLYGVDIEGNQVAVSWNPTMDQEEVYWVEVNREDDDTYSGLFKGEKYPHTKEVIMTRRVFEDDSDLVPFE